MSIKKTLKVHKPEEKTQVDTTAARVQAALCAECEHESDLHYGGPANWCNRSGCECQGIKS